MELTNLGSLADLAAIIWLDVVLSGDNALVIGMAAAALAPHLRKRAILFGVILAIVARIAAALAATYLYEIPWIRILGGLALLWVAYKLFTDVRRGFVSELKEAAEDVAHGTKFDRRSMLNALTTIAIADISMSVDNVLAVAGIAHNNRPMLVFGLMLSIMLMAFGAAVISRLLARHPWLCYVGIAILFLVALQMLASSFSDLSLFA